MHAERPVRQKVLQRFERAVGDDRVAHKLEAGLWYWTLDTCERDGVPTYWANPKYRFRYTTRALAIEYNLKNPANPALRDRVLSGDIDANALPWMSPSEMWPELWKPVEERVRNRQLAREAAIIDPDKVPDGAYTCSRCKSKKTVYTSLQIRSADEPSTQFVRCLKCGRGWKENN